MKVWSICCVLVAVGFLGMDASAGQSGSGGVAGNGSGHKPIGRDHATPLGNNGQQGSTSKKEEKSQSDYKKPELPAAEKVAVLDSTKFDALMPQLGLSEDQVKALDTLKAKLKDEAEKLAKAQDEARAAYEKVTSETGALMTGGQVVVAAANVRSFDGNRKFEAELAHVLSNEQRSKRMELAKK